MANTSSAKKAARKIARRAAVNKIRRSRVRSYVRKVEDALASGDKTAAEAAFNAAHPDLRTIRPRSILQRHPRHLGLRSEALSLLTSSRQDECESSVQPRRTLRTSKDRAHYLRLADTAIAAGQTFFPPKS